MGWNRKTFGELLAQKRPAEEHAVIVDVAHFALGQLTKPSPPRTWPLPDFTQFALLLADTVYSISVVEDDAGVAVWWYTPEGVDRVHLFAV